MNIKEEADENPTNLSSLASDILAFGGGAIITNIILESVTTGYWVANTEMDAATKQQQGYMMALGKAIVGIVLMWISSKYISAGFMKKLGYGISVGFLVNASTDAIDAYANQ